MSEEEIKEYLKRFDELELKLTGEDKDTYQWLLFGYNKCARLLNEKEQENKQLKDVIEELRKYINSYDVFKEFSFPLMKREEENKKDLLQILDKVKENK